MNKNCIRVFFSLIILLCMSVVCGTIITKISYKSICDYQRVLLKNQELKIDNAKFRNFINQFFFITFSWDIDRGCIESTLSGENLVKTSFNSDSGGQGSIGFWFKINDIDDFELHHGSKITELEKHEGGALHKDVQYFIINDEIFAEKNNN